MLWTKIIPIFILFFLPSMGITAEVLEQPSIMVLLKSPSTVPTEESMKLIDASQVVFKASGVFKPITVETGLAFLPNIEEAKNYSLKKKANYMVYMDMRKRGSTTWCSATLADLKEGKVIGMYSDKWSDQKAKPEEVGIKLASDIVYIFSGKIRVEITIESTPSYCEVYRDQDRLGHTGENGFRATLYWKRGRYKIKVCKADCKEWSDTLKVDKNPTNYMKKVKLKHR